MLRIYDFTYTKINGYGFEKTLLIDGKEGLEVKTQKINDLRKQIRKKSEFTILTTNDYKTKREGVDNALIDIIAHNELIDRKDTRNYRFSGVDHVTAKMCAEKNIAVMICFSDFLNAKNKGLILGRMRQNVKLCLKYKTSIIIASGARTKKEIVPADNLIAFAEFLGMNKKQARESVSKVAERIIKR